MKIIKILSVAFVVLLSACAIKKMKAFSECEFKLANVNGVKVAGVNVDPTGKNKLSLPDMLSIGASLSMRKLPVSFDLNIEGKNSNSIEARMARFDWKIKLKGKDVVEGVANNLVRIPANSTEKFGFNTRFDLFPAVNSLSINELKDVLNNAFDSDGNPKDIKFYIKPYVAIGKVNIPYPGFIEISKYYKAK